MVWVGAGRQRREAAAGALRGVKGEEMPAEDGGGWEGFSWAWSVSMGDGSAGVERSGDRSGGSWEAWAGRCGSRGSGGGRPGSL
jgi:hypothetical protein